MPKRRGKKADEQNAAVVDDGYRLARSGSKKLYLKKHVGGPEEAHDWTGPVGAHHAMIVVSSSTHGYMMRMERKISVFDAAGALLGELIEEHWV